MCRCILTPPPRPKPILKKRFGKGQGWTAQTVLSWTSPSLDPVQALCLLFQLVRLACDGAFYLGRQRTTRQTVVSFRGQHLHAESGENTVLAGMHTHENHDISFRRNEFLVFHEEGNQRSVPLRPSPPRHHILHLLSYKEHTSSSFLRATQGDSEQRRNMSTERDCAILIISCCPFFAERVERPRLQSGCTGGRMRDFS